MANFGNRTVHWMSDERPDELMPDGGGYVIHFNNAVWRPANGLTSVMTGDRVYVSVNEDGTITVATGMRFSDSTEIWKKDEA